MQYSIGVSTVFQCVPASSWVWCPIIILLGFHEELTRAANPCLAPVDMGHWKYVICVDVIYIKAFIILQVSWYSFMGERP